MKITRENLKNIVREAMVEESAYQEFFKKALEKTGKSIPDMSDEEKKAFFNKIDSAWKGKGEKNEGNAFGAAVADAKKDGDDSFKVGGKEYKVESNEEDLDEEAVVVSKRTPEGNIVSKLKEELESVNEAKGNPKFKRGDRVKVTGTQYKGKSGLIMSDDMYNGRNSVQIDGKMTGIKPSDLTKESVNEEEIRWGAVDNAIVRYIKHNVKVLEKPIKARDEALTKKMLKAFIDGLVNAQRSLKLESINESINEGTDIYLNKRIQITKFAGQNGQMVQINAPKYQTAGDHIAMSKDEFIRMLKNSSKILNQLKESNESTNERMGSDKGAVGNANFNNRLKAIRADKNSVVAFIDTNKGKKLLKVFKTQQTAQQFTKKNMDKLLNTKGVESVGTMPKKEWDAKEAKYAIK